MLRIDEAQDNGAVEVHVGETFRIQLSENPTTGYRWQLQSPGDPTLRVLEDSFESSHSAYGSGGLHYWTILAAQESVVHLEFELRRTGQPPAVKSFKVTLDVKAR